MAKLILLVIGLGIAFGVAEIGTRLILSEYATDMYKIDYSTGLLVYIPNREGIQRKTCIETEVKINSLGWRDKEFTVEKKEGIKRILFLGDSFTASLEVPLEKTFYRILEDKLNEYIGSRTFETISLGRGGSGMYIYYRYLKDFGLAYKPDIVVVLSFSNDPVDDIHDLEDPNQGKLFDFTESGEIIDDYHYEKSRFLTEVKSFTRKSAFIKLLYDRGDDLLGKIKHTPPSPWIGVEGLERMDKDFAYRLEEAILTKIKNLTDQAGAKLVIVNAPRRAQVEASQDINEPYLFGSFSHEQMLQEIAGKNKISFFNLLPVFRKNYQESKQNFDFPCDIHWNETGQAWVADFLFNQFVNSKELIGL